MSEEVFNTVVAELQERVKVLSEENTQLRRERDWARAIVTRGLPIATEEEEQAFRLEIQSAGPGGQLDELIAEWKAELEPADGR